MWINPNYEGTTVVNSAYDIALVKLASPGAMTALTKAQWNADPNIPAIGMDVMYVFGLFFIPFTLFGLNLQCLHLICC